MIGEIALALKAVEYSVCVSSITAKQSCVWCLPGTTYLKTAKD
jgi:hypothetical protein